MSFRKVYEEKLVSAEKAASLVKSGDRIDYGWAAAYPYTIDKELGKRVKELEDVIFMGGIVFEELEILKADPMGEHITWNSWHVGGLERKMIGQEGSNQFYIPLRYSELPRWYEDEIDLDIVYLVTTPMDKHGYFNFGLNASHAYAAIKKAKTVVIEVNKNMPRCLGGFENAVHITEIDYIVEGSNWNLFEIPSRPASEIDLKVAELVVAEIEDGACIQLGIGGMPGAIGSLIAKSDLKDLGVHSEMYVDAFVEMAKAGKVTGAYKNFDRNRQTYAFAAGGKELYEYLDNNEECLAAPVSYTNSYQNIAKLDKFTSINNALNVDLWGQVSSESTGYRHISGAGGQLDFALGAYQSKGGKAFICLKSTFTDKEGKMHSNIVPDFKQGSVITVPRPITHYIVTEHGMVNLKGMSTWERAEALISIAHPDFRDELIEEAKRMNIWRKTNKIR